MLNNDKSFKRLMNLLRGIDPKNPLPQELEDYLLMCMIVEDYCKKECMLEEEGKVPKKAYYVVRGKVKVYAYCSDGVRYLYRIYRDNTIVALKSFMEQEISEYDIVACRNTLIWSIGSGHMQYIYDAMPGMRELALKTALKYSEVTEKLRTDLLAKDMDTRVLDFYGIFDGLLPARTGPVRDEDVAAFLAITENQLKDARRRSRTKGLLKEI